MRIVFVNPPSPAVGFGVYREDCCTGLRKGKTILPSMLAWMAGVAGEKHTVEIVDLAAEPHASVSRADLFVVSVCCYLLEEDLQFVNWLKKDFPESRVAVVVQPPVLKDWIMRNFPIDYWIGFPRLENFKRLFGVRDDAVSALHLLPLEKYNLTPIYNGNGCPYKCVFCGYGSRKHYYRPLDLVLEEANTVTDNSRAKHVYFIDPNTLLKPSRAVELAERIDGSLKWHIDARVDRRGISLLNQLKHGGCFKLTYGVETVGSGLAKTQKAIKQDWVLEAAENAYAVGLKVNFTFLYGFPWDNNETKRKLISFLAELSKFPNVQLGVNYPIPHPDTPLFDMVKDRLVAGGPVEMYKQLKWKKSPAFPTDYLTVEQIKQNYEEIIAFVRGKKLLRYVANFKPNYLKYLPKFIMAKAVSLLG